LRTGRALFIAFWGSLEESRSRRENVKKVDRMQEIRRRRSWGGNCFFSVVIGEEAQKKMIRKKRGTDGIPFNDQSRENVREAAVCSSPSLELLLQKKARITPL